MPNATPLPLGELLDKTFPPGNNVIGAGLMSRGSILIIGGPPKSYKSFMLNTMLYHLAVGTPLFGATRADRKGNHVPVFPIQSSHKCLLLEQEVGEEDLQCRFRDMMGGLTAPERTLCRERIFTYSCDPDMQLDTYPGKHLISRLIEQVAPHVVAFDPLIEFHQQDENSATAMAKVLHGLSELRAKFSFSSAINHHVSKPQRDEVREGPDKLRGSSVIYAKGDSFITIKPEGHKHGLIRLQFKLRRAAPIEDMYIQLNPDTLRFEFAYWSTASKDERKAAESRPKVVTMRALEGAVALQAQCDPNLYPTGGGSHAEKEESDSGSEA
jgi:hypothetical protein